MQNDKQTETEKLVIADKGTRFGHNIIDTIGFFSIIFLNAMILDGWLGIIPEGGSNWFGIYFFFFMLCITLYLSTFFGKTHGKFLTKTKVVKKDGNKATFINILGRNAARLIPFDALSYLFSKRGWHDQISNTYVVVDKKKK